MPLAAYFDAGGDQVDQRYLVVAGFVAPLTSWDEFEKRWRDRLAADGLKYFHAVEFAHSRKEFDGWRDDEQRRRNLLSDLMEIIKTHVSRKFSNVIINNALNANISGLTKKRFHINAYSLAGRTCAARLREWMTLERWNTSVELIFEQGDIGAGLLRECLMRDGFQEPSFRPKKDRQIGATLELAPTPIQAADWLAYEIFLAAKKNNLDRWAMQEFLTTPGNGGVYTTRDVERLEHVLQTPLEQFLNGKLWDADRLI